MRRPCRRRLLGERGADRRDHGSCVVHHLQTQRRVVDDLLHLCEHVREVVTLNPLEVDEEANRGLQGGGLPDAVVEQVCDDLVPHTLDGHLEQREAHTETALRARQKDRAPERLRMLSNDHRIRHVGHGVAIPRRTAVGTVERVGRTVTGSRRPDEEGIQIREPRKPPREAVCQLVRRHLRQLALLDLEEHGDVPALHVALQRRRQKRHDLVAAALGGFDRAALPFARRTQAEPEGQAGRGSETRREEQSAASSHAHG